jgi:gamma-glutamylcyclotransferase (GGCT)/AIG2-like uncharacterized protein YtfP
MFLIEFDTRHDAPKVYYFAYGLLTDPRIMRGAELIGRGELKNHRLEFRGFANVTESPGDTVYGALWQLPDGFLNHLDQIEGYPEMYDRRTVPVLCDGKKYTAEVYKMTPHYQEYFDTRREPKLDYLSRLARGYIHVGVPNQQLHQAVQQLDNQELAEVAMNPGAYAQSMARAADVGVLVGYEFEVCIPQITVGQLGRARDLDDEMLVREFLSIIEANDDYVMDYHWQRLFKMKPGKTVAIDKGKQVYDDIIQAEADLPDYLNAASGWEFDYRIEYILKSNDLFNPKAFLDTFEIIDSDTLGTYINKFLARVGEEDSNTYHAAARILKDAITDMFGAEVDIFNDYHEYPKDDTTWYIEPDGSLEPDEPEDATAEIVTPPLRAEAAMAVLKRFYTMSQQLGLYTNDSTGLHINVSVPQELDVLKLAVFLGDQYVLQKYGRENSSYAKSVMQGLATYSGHSPEIAQQFITAQSTKDRVDELKKLANRFSSEHSASVSDNGEYISFRHVGGDYLARLDDTANMLGRFVRAMLIAADPDAYRKEYLKKLSQLLGPAIEKLPQADSTEYQNLLTFARNIITNGIPVLEVDISSSFSMVDLYDLPSDVENLVQPGRKNYTKVKSMPNGSKLALTALKQKFPDFYQTREHINWTGKRYHIIPLSLEAAQDIVDLANSTAPHRETSVRSQYRLIRMPPNSPETRALVADIRAKLEDLKQERE